MVIFYGHLSLLEGIVWYCLIKLTTVFFISFVRSMGMLRGDIGANISERKTCTLCPSRSRWIIHRNFMVKHGETCWIMLKHVETRGKQHNFPKEISWIIPLTLPVPKLFSICCTVVTVPARRFVQNWSCASRCACFPLGAAWRSSSLASAGWSWLAGWWYTYPSEKWWSSSVGMMTFPIYGKNVPNHQPDN